MDGTGGIDDPAAGAEAIWWLVGGGALFRLDEITLTCSRSEKEETGQYEVLYWQRVRMR